jgi:hypothetical protein
MNLDEIANRLRSVVDEAANAFVDALPNLVTAVVVLILGWVLAWTLRKIVRRVFGRLTGQIPRGAARAAWTETIDDANAVNVAANGLYWLVLLTTLMVAIDALGLPVFSKWIGAFASYLPQLVIAIALVFGGVLAGRLASNAIVRTASRLPVAQAQSVGRLTQVLIVAAAALIAAEQLGIDVSLVTAVFLIVLAATLGGAAIAFGLGAREMIADILAMYYVNQSYRVGQLVRIGADQGRIVRTTRTSVLLENADGELSIPGRHFIEKRCLLLNQEEDRGA